MKSIITLIITSFAIAFHINAAPLAAPAGEPQNEKSKQRTCRIIFPERLIDSPKFAELFDGKQSQKVQLPTMNFSPVIELAAGEITLFMTAEPITDLKDAIDSTPKLVIPADVDDFYIVVSPDAENPAMAIKMEMIILNDEESKPGQTIWMNKTKHRISANLGTSKMTVDPESKIVSEEPAEASGYYKAEFTYQVKGEGEFKKITEQQWWHDAKSRHLAFVVDTDHLLPKIFIFRDFRTE